MSRAAQRPDILLLTTAIVGVRFFGIARAVLRYLERLVSHDLAFRTLTDLRVAFFRRLVPLVPGGLGAVRGADLLSRFVADADRIQDLYLRALGPPLVALAAGALAVGAAAIMLPAAGLVVAAVLLLAGVAAPYLVRRVARRSGRRQAPARAALTADMVAIAGGAPEIVRRRPRGRLGAARRALRARGSAACSAATPRRPGWRPGRPWPSAPPAPPRWPPSPSPPSGTARSRASCSPRSCCSRSRRWRRWRRWGRRRRASTRCPRRPRGWRR